jgi:hypothetical protein
MKLNASSYLNYLVALISLVFGVIYLTRSEFMPYHRQAVEVEWSEVNASVRVLILALMRAVGGGFLVTAFLITFLQYKSDILKLSWIPPLILTGGSVIILCNLYATLTLKMNTAASPPIFLLISTEILLVAAFLLRMTAKKKV